MNMGLVTATNRHTAFDSTVVFHEFMHGVTNRLVGGPQNSAALEAPQSRGMGEGWSDYVACIINNSTVVGAWVVNRPGGIRGFPYDSNFPDDFGDLGTGRYTGPHAIGEIWCATLTEMTRNIGKTLAVRLVTDALPLSPANPSFLNMRDSILRALDHLRTANAISAAAYTTALGGIWRAFARFGMGPRAQSNGAQLTGIVADSNPGFLHLSGATWDGRLWHTIRFPNGPWQQFGDVEGQTGDRGTIRDVSCATVAGELHLCAVPGDGRLWHTIRFANGTWQQFGDVEGQTGDRGSIREVSAGEASGALHVAATTGDGRLWHTIRAANGTWQPFGDVEGQTGDRGSFCTTSVDG